MSNNYVPGKIDKFKDRHGNVWYPETTTEGVWHGETTLDNVIDEINSDLSELENDFNSFKKVGITSFSIGSNTNSFTYKALDGTNKTVNANAYMYIQLHDDARDRVFQFGIIIAGNVGLGEIVVNDRGSYKQIA